MFLTQRRIEVKRQALNSQLACHLLQFQVASLPSATIPSFGQPSLRAVARGRGLTTDMVIRKTELLLNKTDERGVVFGTEMPVLRI